MQAASRGQQSSATTLERQYGALALPDDQLQAVLAQVEGTGTSGVWHSLNAHLRASLGHADWLSDTERARIELIDSALQPLTEPVCVYRRMRARDLTTAIALSVEPGSFVEHAYLSTSVDADYATARPDDALLQIDIPAGTPALWIPAIDGHHSPTEQELLLARGLRLCILADETGPDGRRCLQLAVELSVAPLIADELQAELAALRDSVDPDDAYDSYCGDVAELVATALSARGIEAFALEGGAGLDSSHTYVICADGTIVDPTLDQFFTGGRGNTTGNNDGWADENPYFGQVAVIAPDDPYAQHYWSHRDPATNDGFDGGRIWIEGAEPAWWLRLYHPTD
jgi:hypothetical protein